MAGEAVVQIEDEGVVEVALDGLVVEGDVVDEGAGAGGKKKPEVVVTQKPAAADEAAKALTEAVGKAEAARVAAEQTAAAERRNADEARQALARSNDETKRLRETAESQELTIITNGLTAATKDMEAAQAAVEAAAEAGDFKAGAAAQTKLARAAAAVDRLEADKTAYENGTKRAPAHEGRVEQPVSQQSAFDRYLSGFTPVAQAWLRQHPDFVPAQVGGDGAKNAKMMAGHYEAIGKGIPEGTPAYFEAIEQHVGLKTPVSAAAEITAAGAEPQARKPAQPRPQPSAPPTRDGPEGNPGSTRSVRLTPQQQEAALFSYPQNQGEAEAAWKKRALGTYASEFVKAQAEGKIGRMTH